MEGKAATATGERRGGCNDQEMTPEGTLQEGGCYVRAVTCGNKDARYVAGKEAAAAPVAGITNCMREVRKREGHVALKREERERGSRCPEEGGERESILGIIFITNCH